MSAPSPSYSAYSSPQSLNLSALAASLKTALDALTPFVSTSTGLAFMEEFKTNSPVVEKEEEGEIRVYRVPPVALQYERELLGRFQAQSSFDLMDHMLERLAVTVTLMEQVDAAQDLPEHFIQMLGGHLRESLDTLEAIASIFRDMEPLHIRTL